MKSPWRWSIRASVPSIAMNKRTHKDLPCSNRAISSRHLTLLLTIDAARPFNSAGRNPPATRFHFAFVSAGRAGAGQESGDVVPGRPPAFSAESGARPAHAGTPARSRAGRGAMSTSPGPRARRGGPRRPALHAASKRSQTRLISMSWAGERPWSLG